MDFSTALGSASQTAMENADVLTIQEELLKKIRLETEKYQQENRNLLENFEQNLSQIIEADFTRAEQEIPTVVDDLSGWVTCNKLCYKFAKDSLTGSDDATQAVRPVLGKILDACAAGTGKAENLLQNLRVQLAEKNTEFRTALAAIGNTPEFAALDTEMLQQLSKNILHAEAAIQDVANSTVGAEVSVALEVVSIRSTTRIVSSVLSKVIARIVGTATVSAISAAADGPLPIGDVFGAVAAVGGAVWTTWDLYKARKELPEQLENGLQNSVQTYRTKVLETTRVRAAEMRSAFDANGDTLARELEQNL